MDEPRVGAIMPTSGQIQYLIYECTLALWASPYSRRYLWIHNKQGRIHESQSSSPSLLRLRILSTFCFLGESS